MAKQRSKAGSRAGRSRRGKGEGMTGKKEATVEKRKIGEELKLAKPDDILHHMKVIKGWKDKIATLSSHVRAAYKTAKAAKISKDTLDFLLGLERNDPNEYRAEMETIGIGLKAVGAPFQLNVFDTAYASDIEQAKAEATQAAKAGRGPECRFAEGSDAFDAYMEAYALVQSGMAPGADKLTDEEKADAIAAGRSSAKTAELTH